MKKAFIIFQGWASTNNLYSKFKMENYDIIYISDTNIDNIREKINGYNEYIFFAWSLGTLICIELLNSFNVTKAVFLAPTLNFTMTTPKIVLKKMIRDLKKNKEKTIENFLELNFYSKNFFYEYLKKYSEDILKINESVLEEGLNILMEKNLENILIKNQIEPLIILGKEDKIISNENSIYFAEKFNKKKIIILEKTGHNIIFEKDISMFTDEYLKEHN